MYTLLLLALSHYNGMTFDLAPTEAQNNRLYAVAEKTLENHFRAHNDYTDALEIELDCLSSQYTIAHDVAIQTPTATIAEKYTITMQEARDLKTAYLKNLSIGEAYQCQYIQYEFVLSR